MDYTRHSSQPATVDLVRADLAEIWTIGEDKIESPERPPSVSGVSDMLDLEYIPTPGLRPSKTIRKDPLPSLLGDILEVSPSRKRGRSNPDGRYFSSKPSRTGNKKSSQHVQSRNRPAKDSTTATSSPAAHLISPEELHDSPRATQKPTRPASLEQPPANANQRCRPKQQTEGTGNSPMVSPTPNPRRPQESNTKPAPPSTAPKGSTRLSKTRPGTSNLASTRTKNKARKQDDDVYDLTDTDTDEDPRPKKRQAKPSSPKQARLPPDSKARNANEGGARAGTVLNQGNKSTGTTRTRVPKKPSRRDVARGNEMEVEPIHSDTAVYDDQALDLNIDPENKPIPARAKSEFDQQPQLAGPKSAALKTGSPQESLSPKLPGHLALASSEKESLHLAAPEPREVITVSSESPGEGDAVRGSTSPLFIEQDQQHVTSDGPDIAVTVNPASSSDQRLPTRLLTNHVGLGFTPPPSFQPHAFSKRPQTHSVGRPLPAALRQAFLSDAQPEISPSPSPELDPSSEGDLNPDDIWKHAVKDDAPPVIMHRIVTVSAARRR